MNRQTVGCLVFLALMKNFFCYQRNPFELEDNQLTATEGSCIEIICKVKRLVSDANDAYWFWMKDAKWIDAKKDFDATIIYSSNDTKRPVSPEFADRVKYIGSSSSSWRNVGAYTPQPPCSVLICNLNKTTDSGQYSFRYIGGSDQQKWTTKTVTLTVTENFCPITFEKPPVVKENDKITLTCSTLNSCPSSLQIQDLSQFPQTQLSTPQPNDETHKSTTVSFTASWQDDGRLFSCHTQDNKDKYLIRNVSVTVEYSPKDISAKKSSEDVKEGDSVTLSCSAKGVPTTTFSWTRNGQQVSAEAEWMIPSISVSQSGEYTCQAQNKHGNVTSVPVTIDVKYAPDVEIKKTPPTAAVREGDKMTLTCDVKRSNPPPHTYTWWKDGTQKGSGVTYVVEHMMPEDRGLYTCRATNTVGATTSNSLLIQVEYQPRNTRISITEANVKVDRSLSFICDTDAYPAPRQYSWYRYNIHKTFTSSQWTSKRTPTETLTLQNVQRGDEAYYICNATNSIGTGADSEPLSIHVQYPPTEPVLSMAAELTEGQKITISCTVESFPSSVLTLTRTSTSNSQSYERPILQPGSDNQLYYTFNVTSADAGDYTCNAKNSEGSRKSKRGTLVVKYTPKNVAVQAQPAFVLKENESLTLSCTAQSYPQANSFTWRKMSDGKEKIIGTTQEKFIVTSVSPSDSGLYSCEAKNEIGKGVSTKVQVNVEYGPKYTNIIMAAEKQERDGKRSVKLSCSSDGYPPAKEYLWYKKETSRKTEEVSKSQNYTVYSHKPGEYYCVAKNEIGKNVSAPVNLFDGRLMMFLKIFLSLLLILLIILIIFFIYRHRKNKVIQRGSTQPCFGILDWSSSIRRGNLTHETALAEPFRSRDVLLPDQLYHPEAQRHRPRPDSTPASNVTSVYCTVNLPPKKQAPTGQKPTRPQGGHTVEDSLNYASLSFGDKQKNKLAEVEVDVVYAQVSKPKNEPEWLVDYENVSTTRAAKFPAPLDDDSDTSDDDDDTQVNYTQVTFTANPGHQRASGDSSSEDEIHYSDVKI